MDRELKEYIMKNFEDFSYRIMVEYRALLRVKGNEETYGKKGLRTYCYNKVMKEYMEEMRGEDIEI